MSLDAISPLSRYQQEHVDGWNKVVMLMTLGLDRKHLIIVRDYNEEVGVSNWENFQKYIDPAVVPSGKQHSVKVNLDTARDDQHNIVVLSKRHGSYYHARFSTMVLQ